MTDLPRSVQFYRDAFGWTSPVGTPTYTEFSVPGGMRLGLYRRESFALNTGRTPWRVPEAELAPTELYLHVPDVPSAIARIERAGARLLSPLSPREWGDEAAYFADPDGNVLVLARPMSSR